MISRTQPPPPKGQFLLGFVPFFQRELLEWKYEKRGAIALLILLPLLANLLAVGVSRFFAWQTGRPFPVPDLTFMASSASNSLWIMGITLLLSIGIMPKEVEQGTLAWNLTKPLSRVSFLLGKWAAYTLMIWTVGVVLVNLTSFTVAAIGLGGSMPDLGRVLLAQLAGLCGVGFWVLVCILFGLILKDQAAIIAAAAALGLVGFLMPNLALVLPFLFENFSQETLQLITRLYPSNTLDWLTGDSTLLKAIAYFLYIGTMAIVTKRIFDSREYS